MLADTNINRYYANGEVRWHLPGYLRFELPMTDKFRQTGLNCRNLTTTLLTWS